MGRIEKPIKLESNNQSKEQVAARVGGAEVPVDRLGSNRVSPTIRLCSRRDWVGVPSN